MINYIIALRRLGRIVTALAEKGKTMLKTVAFSGFLFTTMMTAAVGSGHPRRAPN